MKKEAGPGPNIRDEKMLEYFQRQYGDPLGFGLKSIVFRNGDSAIKVFYKDNEKKEVFDEVYKMIHTEAAGIDAPKVLKVEEENGYWTIHMTLVSGKSLLFMIIEAVMNKDMDRAGELIEHMAAFQAEINSKDIIGIPSCKEAVLDKIAENTVLSEKMKEKVMDYLRRLPDGNKICHGDFHPNQILVDENGGFKVIDWADMGAGTGASDAALTWLNLHHAPMPVFSQTGLDELYLETYSKKSGIAKERILEWIPVEALVFLTNSPAAEGAEEIKKYIENIN